MTATLLISTYEQGRQPLGLAAPAALLRADGHEVRTLDLSVEEPHPALYDWAELIGISTPMHTAARLGLALARQLCEQGHGEKIAFYGVGAVALDSGQAGRALSGDTDRQLLALARGEAPDITFDRAPRPTPDRRGLPPLDRYARYHAAEGEFALAGYVEASRGCAHRCTHCPLTPVYEGRLRLAGAESVLADIDQQAAMGAQHVTFGDPDFFNAPTYGIELLEAARGKHKQLTFDITVKVEHLLEHRQLLSRLRALGVSFITSAFESVDDNLLRILDKGHSAADLDTALALCDKAGIALRPTWLPFTPWTSPQDYLDLLEFIETRNLIPAVPPVQLGLRLLVPPASPLAAPIRQRNLLEAFDQDGLIWHWRHPDPLMDRLQAEAAALTEAAEGAPPTQVFRAVKQLANKRLNATPWPDIEAPTTHIPGLTESWFC